MSKRSLLSQLSRALYKASRLSGDLAALQKGPDKLAKRVVKRQINRQIWRIINRLFRFWWREFPPSLF